MIGGESELKPIRRHAVRGTHDSRVVDEKLNATEVAP
jgi:hypothetical protein